MHIRDLFAKETDPAIFTNLEVAIPKLGGAKGKIVGTFGKSGKLKVRLHEPFDESQIVGGSDTKSLVGSEVLLKYKKNMMKKQANKFKSDIKI